MAMEEQGTVPGYIGDGPTSASLPSSVVEMRTTPTRSLLMTP